jgi:PIN domain nuclease of toxin-antitoxin system
MRARRFIDDAGRADHRIAVSVISLAEIVYLMEKGRLRASAYDDLRKVLDDPSHVLVEVPVTPGVVESMRSVPREAVPDMPDRIVAATAVHLGVPVISRDGMIRASSVQTIW